jgi:serine/threonine protein kinase
LPNYISDELKEFLVLLLEKNPEKRITISQMYAHPFYMKHHSAWGSVRGLHGE